MDKVDKQRLREIRQEMIDLLGEAQNLLRQHAPADVYSRARNYWIGHVDTSLGGGEYVDTHDYSFEKTLKELSIDPDLDVEIADDEEDLDDAEDDENTG